MIPNTPKLPPPEDPQPPPLRVLVVVGCCYFVIVWGFLYLAWRAYFLE